MSLYVKRYSLPALLLAIVAMIVIAVAATAPSLAGSEASTGVVCCCGPDCQCVDCNCDGVNCTNCNCPGCDCAEGCACGEGCGSKAKSCCAK